MKINLDVIFVDYKTPELAQVVLDSFTRFSTSDFDVRFIAIENSEFDLLSSLKTEKANVKVINNPTNLGFSHAHGDGLEKSKSHIRDGSEYIFTCHSDVCVTSSSFFDELKDCIEEDVYLAGVCEDKHEERVRAIHCSGLLSKVSIFKSVSMMPNLPRIDTTDLLTLHCRENSLKMKLFNNTYNDSSLVDVCNSPFKELGKNCGIDRCLDRNNNVMFMHQGRGTSKYTGSYSNQQKITTSEWLKICKDYT